MKRAVLCTSSSCLDYLNLPHDIGILRMHLNINNVDFLEGKNINPDVLQRIMRQDPDSVSRTLPPNLQDMVGTLTELYHQSYDEVFILTASSQFSESYRIANEARELFTNRLKIHVYDTKTINFSEAALAIEAEQMIKQGKTIPEIVWRLDNLRNNNQVLFTVDNLSYLIRYNKISAPVGFLANLLDIKPVLEINQKGEVIVAQKIRKIEKTLSIMTQQLEKIISGRPAFVYVMDAGSPELTEYFTNLLKQKFGVKQIPVTPVCPISVVNHGPDAVGFGVFVDEIPYIAKFYQ